MISFNDPLLIILIKDYIYTIYSIGFNNIFFFVNNHNKLITHVIIILYRLNKIYLGHIILRIFLFTL